MKLDKKHRDWMIKRIILSGLGLIAIVIIARLCLNDIVVDYGAFYSTAISVVWFAWVLFWMREAMNDQRNKLGLKPHWTDSEIDELENRVAALEEQLDSVD